MAALLGLTLLAFPERCSLEGAVGHGEDLAEHDLPLAALFHRAMTDGEHFPRWNPHKGIGVPAWEAPFMGPYYPGFLLYRLLPHGAAVNLGFLGHIFISGLFMFLLCRRLGCGGLAAWLGAASWILSSVFRLYSYEGWLPETVSAAYLPVACFLLLGLVRTRGAVARVCWLVAAGSCLALMILGGHPSYMVVAVLAALLFGLVSVRAWSGLALVGASLLLGAALSSLAWGPLLYEASLTPHRALGELGKMSASPFSPGELLNYLVYATGDERLHFVGRPLLLLGVAGAVISLWRRRWGVPAVLVVAGLLAINTLEAATKLPLLNLVSVPGTWHMALVLALAAGGAVALNELGRALNRRQRWRRLASVVVLVLAGLQLADLALYRARMPSRWRQPLAEYFRAEPFSSFLATDTSLFRVLSFPEEGPLWRMNQGTLSGVDAYNARVKGVGVHRLTGQVALSSEVENRLDRRVLRLLNVKYWLITRDDASWDESRHPPGMELALRRRVTVQERGGSRDVWAVVLRHRDPFPRAFLVGGSGQEDADPVLVGVKPEPLQRLRISERAWAMLDNHRPVQVRRQGNHYLVDYEADGHSLLVLSEMFHPAWRVTLDGRPAQVVSPLTVFIGAQAPAGKHRLVFEFRPDHLVGFWALSLAGMATALGLLIWALRRSRRGSLPQAG